MRLTQELNRFIILTVLGLLSLASAITGNATSIQIVQIETLAQRSSHVVEGTVAKVTSQWNNGRSSIISQVTITRKSVLKGDVPTEISIFLPGGSVDGRTSIIVGAPEFRVGQGVVVFLNRLIDINKEPGVPTRAESFQLSDLFQGSFRVIKDPTTGEQRVISNAVKLLEQSQAPDSLNVIGGTKGLTLTELRAKVNQAR